MKRAMLQYIRKRSFVKTYVYYTGPLKCCTCAQFLGTL